MARLYKGCSRQASWPSGVIGAPGPVHARPPRGAFKERFPVLSHLEAAGCVIKHERMASGEGTAPASERLRPDDGCDLL
jgi:hypothetical protein